MKDEKKCAGWWLKWKREKWNIVYMYGVFIVECISLSLLTTKYVYLKFLFISVQKKLKLLFFKSLFCFIYMFFWNKSNGLLRESIWYLDTWTTLNILRCFVSLEGTTTFSVNYRIKLYSTINNTLKEKIKCLFKWYKIYIVHCMGVTFLLLTSLDCKNI